MNIVKEVLVSSFSVSIEDLCSEISSRVVDTLYYIAGWTLVVLNKIAGRLVIFVICVVLMGKLQRIKVFRYVKLIVLWRLVY